MGRSRRAVLLLLGGSAWMAGQEQQQSRVPEANPKEDERLPDGKSRNDAIAKQEHKRALQEADELLAAAQQLKDELRESGEYVVPVAAVKKTEEIERLARRIRGRLKQ